MERLIDFTEAWDYQGSSIVVEWRIRFDYEGSNEGKVVNVRTFEGKVMNAGSKRQKST